MCLQTWEDKETHYNVSTALQTDVELNPLDTDGFITKLKWLQVSLPAPRQPLTAERHS